ncbi:MAG TPA: SRPBCC domain-containing protein [Acidimicrobiales bacterium]|nr:SRPBCC domain-containing protein [Acidimicrobiales bacterium]
MTEVAELNYRRVHRAPRELIFECMTTPEHLAQFWGPSGSTTPIDGITVDLRPGGVFETLMISEVDGSQYTMSAVYQDIEPPERLVWRESASGMVTTITFNDLGDGTTEVVTHQANVPAHFRTPAARSGFATSLDRFDAYVAALNAANPHQDA